MNLLQEIEHSLSHPMENGNYFPPLPGESASSHRRRTQVLSLHKLFRAHVPSAPLPQTTPIQTTRKHMTEQAQADTAIHNTDPASLKALLQQLQATIKQLGGGTKIRKTRLPGETFARRLGTLTPGIGGIMRKFRYDKNMPQKKFAELAGLPVGAVTLLEKSPKRSPDFTEIQGVAKAIGISVADLAAKIEASLAVA